MHSTRPVPVFLAACLATAAACSDPTASTTGSGTPTQISTGLPPLVTLTGVIHTGGSLDQLVLAIADGSQVTLTGSETVNLRSLENDEVEVRGSWATDILPPNNILLVSDFVVRQVGGVDVLDGILTTLYDTDTGTEIVGYAISLTGGSTVTLIDPPQELINLVGQRLWVATSAEGKPQAFGVIGPPTM
jgi:hypothetical protein